MTEDGEEEDTIVNLQSRESVDWLRAARDDEEDDAEDHQE